MGLFGLIGKKEVEKEFSKVRDSFKNMKKDIDKNTKDISEIKSSVKAIQTSLENIYATKEQVAEIRGMMKAHKAKPQITKEIPETRNKERAIKRSNIKVYTMPDVNEIKSVIKTYVSKNYSIAYIKRELVDKLKKCTKPTFYRYVKQMGYS